MLAAGPAVAIWREIRARDHGDSNYTIKPSRS
jgi:hypothetical protein